ncbi:hypothetical protein JAAARDRAFT_54366 [Jaapia argillacea MUCL 33604]|uniref:Uncharacterized protein n=1 Tax=Jaapia argillacea MUCL 33604 TaxID=933084 RepID=A0A067QFX4_9AGAM|nr:hypothetical protein JAAARDRAFT_54366 [Jaapia argillacea MUCL 33604]
MSSAPTTSPTPISELKVSIKVKPHYSYPRHLTRIEITVKHPNHHAQVASLSALHIRREFMRGRFLEVMDEESQELHEFSATLFDKNGFLRPWLIENQYHNGTGIWGREVDQRSIVYLSELEVDKDLRGQGIGTWTFQQLLSVDHVKQSGFIFCWPSPSRDPLDLAEFRATGQHSQESKQRWADAFDHLTNFFHKNDFRRVGRTDFLAYALDPSHPSHTFPADQDVGTKSNFELPKAEEDDDEAGSEATGPPGSFMDYGATQTREKLRQALKYPLHSIVVSDKECTVETTIRALVAAKPSLLHSRDAHGVTPLFLAACNGTSFAVRTLLELGAGENGGCERRDNADGLAPLEALAAGMRTDRELCETLMGKWDGFRQDDLRKKYLLKKAMGKVADGLGEEDCVKMWRWGCSYGQCVEGWLSPRMRWRLKAQADMMYDSTSMELTMFTPRQPLSLEEASIDMILPYVRSPARDQIFKTFYEGYRLQFKAISDILGRTPFPSPLLDALPIPTVRNISAHLASFIYGGQADRFASQQLRFFISHGGDPIYALDCMTHSAREQSPLGDGEWDRTFEEDWEEGGPRECAREWRGSVRCKNDLEFGLVREMFGLEGTRRWGPYPIPGDEDEENEGMFVDSDEEDEDDEM